MIWSEIKDLVNSMSEEQLTQDVLVSIEDSDRLLIATSIDTEKEAHYWDMSDYIGIYQDVVELAKNENIPVETLLESLSVTPIGRTYINAV